MNDAVALLAISQLVCLAALIYLYTQMQALRARLPGRRPQSTRVHPMGQPIDVAARRAATQAARQAYATPARVALRADSSTIAARMAELGVDVPTLARRLHKSEEEVRLLLRRGAVGGRELAG